MRISNFFLFFVICLSLTTAEPSFSDFIDNLPRQISNAWNKLIDVIKTPIRLRRLGRRGRRKTTTTTTTVTQRKDQSPSTALDFNVFSPEHYIYRPKTTTKPRQGVSVPIIKYQHSPLLHFGDFQFRENKTTNFTTDGQQNATTNKFDLSTPQKPNTTLGNWPGPLKQVTENSTLYKTHYVYDNYEPDHSLSPQNKVQIPIILQPTTKRDSKRNLKISTKNDWIYFVLNGATKEIINKIDDDNTIIPFSTNPVSLLYNITRSSSTKTYTKKIIHKKKITTRRPTIREIILVSNSDFDVNK